MKIKEIILVTVLALTTVLSVNAQKIKALDTITFKKIPELFGSKKHKNILKVKTYQTKNGDWLNLGDTLVIGAPSNSNNIERVNTGQLSTVSNVNHTHIFLGTLGSTLMGASMFANEQLKGDKVFITDIFLYRMSKKNEYKASVSFNKVGGGRFFGIKKLGRADIENALESGEIINEKAGLTREQAIAKLKEQKDLLDLGMISQEDFDKLRKELTPIIMNKN